MSERYTKKDATKAFERLCELLGKRVATSYNDVGAWALDYNPYYGGYVVEEVSNEAGGISQPLGSARCSARELWDRVWFVSRAFEVSERLDSVEVGK